MLLALGGCSAHDGERAPGVETRDADAGAGRPAIVFYYANETSDTADAAARMDRFDALLSRAWNAVPQGDGQLSTRTAIDRERAFLKSDRRDFPVQVAKDIRGLEKQICLSSAYRRFTSLFIFTNKTARDGNFLFCMASPNAGSLERGEYPLALVESAVSSANYPASVVGAFKDSPLLFSPGLRAARDLVQLKMAGSGINLTGAGLTVIVKSHHGESLAMTSRHANGLMVAGNVSDQDSIQALIAQGGTLSPSVTGITATEFAKEVTTLSASPEVVIFDHANTQMSSALSSLVRSAFGDGKDLVFIPAPAVGSYESVSWGNLPPAKTFAESLRAVLKSR